MAYSSLSGESIFLNEPEKSGPRRRLNFVPVFNEDFEKLSNSSNSKSILEHPVRNKNSDTPLQSYKEIPCNELPVSTANEANNPCKTNQKSYCNVSASQAKKLTMGPQNFSYSESLEDVLESSKENQSMCSSSSHSMSRIIKRKVLRHSSGEAFISEEESTFTPSSDSIFSCDSSSIGAPSFRGSWLSLSGSSRDTESESVLPISVTNLSQKGRRRKCDPVSRYHEYRKYWEAFKPPGEKSHQSLRWAIREKMLEHDTR